MAWKSDRSANIPALEPLEPRALLAAVTAQLLNPYTDTGSLYFNVRFASDRPIDVSTIDGDEIRAVRTEGGFDALARFEGITSASGNSALARYRVLAPADHGQWRFITDDGHYVVKLEAGTVQNNAGDTNAAADLRTFSLWFGAPVISSAGTLPLDVYGMGYTGLPDSSGRVAVNDLAQAELRYETRTLSGERSAVIARLVGPNGYDQTLTVTPQNYQFVPKEGGGFVAVLPLNFAAPGTTWDAADAGQYTLTLRFAPMVVPGFNPPQTPVLFTRAFDVQAKGVTAEIASVSVTSGEMLVTMRYRHPSGIDLATVANGDIKVAISGTGLVAGTLIGTPLVENGVVTAVYRVAEPGAGWGAVPGGSVTVRTGLQEVRATNGETIGFALSRTVRVASGGRVEGVVRSAYTTVTKLVVVMRYSSDQPIDLSTLGDDDLRLTGPFGYDQTGDLVQVVPQANGEVLAVYHFRPNSFSGQWDFRVNNGRYDLAIQPGTISEVNGDSVRDGFVRSFGMFFQNPVVTMHDEQVPNTGTAQPYDFVELDSVKFVLKYVTQDIRVNRENVLSVKVKGPNGAELESYRDYWRPGYRSTHYATEDDITFEFVPPGGGWDYTDDGVYTVEVYLQPNTYYATPGVPVRELLFTRRFTVDSEAPRARIVSTAVAYNSVVATVRFDSPTGISVSSLGNGDLGLMLASNYTSAFPFSFITNLTDSVLVGSPIVESDGSVVATYRINSQYGAAWDRTWDLASVYVRPGQVTDTQGRVAGTARLQNITVAPPPPVVNTIGTLTTSRSSWVVEVAYNNIGGLLQPSSINSASLAVSAPNNAPTRVFVDSVLAALDGTVRVRYRIAPLLFNAALPNGTYTLSLAPNTISLGAAGYLPATTLGTFSNMVFS